MDIAIVNTKILTLRGNNLGIIDEGGIGISGDYISYIGKMNSFDYKNANIIIDGTKKLTMPGLVNAHTHTGLTLLRGCAQDIPEIEWMNKGIGPFVAKMTSNDFIIGSKLGVIEGLKSGTTTFCEYTRDVADIVEKVYLPFNTRVVATETINEVNTNRVQLKPTDIYEFDRGKGEEALKCACNLIRRYKSNKLVSCSLGPQALDMISLDLLKSIQEIAINQNCGLHMHIAQGGRERLQIIGRYGKDVSTISVLEQNKLLDENLLAAHCHDTTISERELMVKRGVKMVGCPSSISMIDGIVPPIEHYSSLGGLAGLGSDQAPGTGLHNIFCEMRTIAILSKTLKKNPTLLPAWEVIQLGTKGGSKILGLDDKIGSLEKGKKADIITIDLTSPNLTPIVTKPFRNYIPNIVYSATGYEIDNVIINGKLIITNRKFVSIDEEKIVKEANKRAEKIFENATDDWFKANSQMVNYMKKGFL